MRATAPASSTATPSPRPPRSGRTADRRRRRAGGSAPAPGRSADPPHDGAGSSSTTHRLPSATTGAVPRLPSRDPVRPRVDAVDPAHAALAAVHRPHRAAERARSPQSVSGTSTVATTSFVRGSIRCSAPLRWPRPTPSRSPSPQGPGSRVGRWPDTRPVGDWPSGPARGGRAWRPARERGFHTAASLGRPVAAAGEQLEGQTTSATPGRAAERETDGRPLTPDGSGVRHGPTLADPPPMGKMLTAFIRDEASSQWVRDSPCRSPSARLADSRAPSRRGLHNVLAAKSQRYPRAP